jgi:hypothetical protein
LEYHSGDFFTDVTDLSRAYDYFSDAAAIMLCHKSGGGGGTGGGTGGIFPHSCASSIAGRAAANSNFYPAPNRFWQFSRPRIFEVTMKGRQNQVLVDRLARRLMARTAHRHRSDGRTSRSTMLHSAVGVRGTSVTESLPFLRRIVPFEVDPLVDNLYSLARDEHQQGGGGNRRKKEIIMSMESSSQRQAEEEAGLLKEQEEILEKDGIVDDDSTSSNDDDGRL